MSAADILLNRRETLGAIAAASLFAPSAAVAKRPPPCPIATPLDSAANALLAHLPEIATYNGVPAAMNGGPLARRMDDYSPAGEAAWRQALKDQQAALETAKGALPDCSGDPQALLRYRTAQAILANGVASVDVPYGRPNPFWFSGHVPYLITQIAGPHIDTPNVMQSQQSVSTVEEIDAWIEKLDGFDKGFAAVGAKLKADAAAGCLPPRMLLEKALPVFDAFLAGKPEDHPLIVSLRERTTTAKIDARTRDAAIKRATTALQRRARPAYERLREQIAAMVPKGRTESGLWAQPQGDALYAANVRSLGDTTLSPEEVHRIGTEEVARIVSEMDVLLRKVGLSKGSVGDRMLELGRDPANLFPDSDAGRQQVLDYIRGLVREMERRQTSFLPSAMIPRQKMEVRRVPPATEAGAPGGFYDGPSLDGARPGIYWINLRDMAAVPRYDLPSLTWHEGVPGHHTQGAIALSLPEAPVIIRIASFNAYSEGWALYAERLAAELGVYRTDPKGDLGRLSAELHRAIRLVVDTGIHALRWDRTKAIAYMHETSGNAMSETVAEIERYMAWPGQALGYKLGQLRILELREQARKAKGKRFDRKAFHAAVLGQGAVPMEIVASEVARVMQ